MESGSHAGGGGDGVGKRGRGPVLLAAACLLGLWLLLQGSRILADPEGGIRLVLGAVLCVWILLRSKDVPVEAPREAAPGPLLAAAGAGVLLVVGGLIFGVHQAEWLGLMLILYACFRWALPPVYRTDIAAALFLLYWVHPLPGNLFGRFEILLQSWTVRGSEWLLQVVGGRVWADGMVLRTPFRVFGVPESCGGFRTAVTVMLCAAGVGVLIRLRWYETLAFVVLGAGQALVANVLRVVVLVGWSAKAPTAWGPNALHDTLGVFLLSLIVLLPVELTAWKAFRTRRRRRREGVRRGELEPPERASILPEPWRIARRWLWPAAAVLLAALCAAFGVWRTRPARRLAILREIVDGWVDSDLKAAERALAEAFRLAPGDRDLTSRKIRILVLRGRYPEALALLDAIPNLSPYETILRSWALVKVGRIEEAAAIVEKLPPEVQRLPGVAIVRAEYAAVRNRTEEVARYALLASRHPSLAGRVRALFPYLASHAQWSVISDADGGEPYADIGSCLIAVHAHVRVNDLSRVVSSLGRGLGQWPDDVRFQGSLFAVALKRPGGEWEGLFLRNVERNLTRMDADALALGINYCFRLGRPDHAWILFLRLKALDPSHPVLPLMAAWFGDRWFVFRRHAVGVRGRGPEDRINLRAAYGLTRRMEEWGSVWAGVPLAASMGGGGADAARAVNLRRSLEEFGRREKAGQLTPFTQMLHSTALAMAGRYEEAHARLNELESRYADRLAEILFQRAVFYEQEGRWQEAYETLRRYRAEAEMPNLTAELMTVNSQMHLNMGVAAMETATRALALFPGVPQANVALAALWDAFGFAEEAVFTLEPIPAQEAPRALPQLLHDTGRYRQAEQAGAVLGVRPAGRPSASRQGAIMPAESATAKLWPPPLTERDMAREAERLEREAQGSVSPFVKRLRGLEAAWHRAGGKGEASSREAWVRAGRDETERATSLHRLAMLQARQKEHEEAAKSIRDAVSQLPQAAALWRAWISLTSGDPAVVASARRACPRDPEIWLAYLGGIRDKDAALAAARAATDGAAYSVGALVRGGDLFLRRGWTDAACVLGRHAAARSQGLLSAYLLGLRCALAAGDRKWALQCAMNAAENAVDPGPFHVIAAGLRSRAGSVGADAAAGLEELRVRFPEQPIWSERLGYVYFQKGDTRRALSVLAPLVDRDVGSMRVQSLVLAAEAARVEGSSGQAARILEIAHNAYPERVDVLNNLVYSLAEEPGTLPRARALLPRLLEMGGELPGVLDTAARVHLKSGDMGTARTFMDRALSRVEPKDYAALEIRLNAAEILYRAGEREEARRRVEEVRRASNRSDFVDQRARALLREMEKERGIVR